MKIQLIRLTFFVLISSLSTLAFAQTNTCYTNEYDDKTQKKYTSESVYNEVLEDWWSQGPPTAGPISLLRAYNLYRKEKNYAQSLGNDKRAHCYIGCRLAQKINVDTAVYVGWYKEYQDLTDCDLNTRFDELDFVATARGAEIGEQQSEPASCHSTCSQIY